MRKKITALFLAAVLLMLMAPAAFAQDLMEDARYYAKQDRSRTCTLASAAMMLRRRAYLDGLGNWTDVTESDLRGTAWSDGLVHNFTYEGMTVGYGSLSGSTADREAQLQALLAEHPEGIVVYDRSAPHAILLTDYTDGTFYCADPAGNTAFGRMPVSYASISLSAVSGYWYVASDANTQLDTAAVSSIALLGVYYPDNVQAGTGFDLGGILKCADGASITKVDVEILQMDRTVIQAAESVPETQSSEWALRNVNSEIRFGALAEGTYLFRIYAEDSQGDTLEFSRCFAVSGSSESVLYFWSSELRGDAA